MSSSLQTNVSTRLDRVVRARLNENISDVANTMKLIKLGLPWAAEEDPARLVQFVARQLRIHPQEAKRRLKKGAIGPESIQGGSTDFVPISFMEEGLKVGRPVGRVTNRYRKALGTGFLIADGVLITNHHVIPNHQTAARLLVEFGYETDFSGKARASTVFGLRPDTLFVTDPIEGLDFTVVAVGARVAGQKVLNDFAALGLSKSATKHAKGEPANIIQHPSGRRKEAVIRENIIAGRNADVIHYVSDTERGSSGSPVFNSNWKVIALHHWGGTHSWDGGQNSDYRSDQVNEGIRVSRIVEHLETLLTKSTGDTARLIKEIIRFGETT